MQKKLDKLGRILIPQSMRNEAGFNLGDYLELSFNKNTKTVSIEHISEKCSICESENDLQTVDNIILCKVCLNKIKNS